MKMFCQVCCVAVLVCGVVGVLMAQSPLDPIDPIDDGATIIEAASEGYTTLAVAYGAENTADSTCTGPTIACGVSPSADCTTGDCNGISSLTAPTCVASTSWIFSAYCYMNGVECQNGTCPDGFTCQNSMEGMCTSTWWWPW